MPNQFHCHCPVDYVLENWPTGIFNLYSKLHYGSLCWLYLEWCLICNYIYICILEYLQHDKFCAGDFWSQTIVIWNVKQKMNGFGMPLPLPLSLPCHCQRNWPFGTLWTRQGGDKERRRHPSGATCSLTSFESIPNSWSLELHPLQYHLKHCYATFLRI